MSKIDMTFYRAIPGHLDTRPGIFITRAARGRHFIEEPQGYWRAAERADAMNDEGRVFMGSGTVIWTSDADDL